MYICAYVNMYMHIFHMTTCGMYIYTHVCIYIHMYVCLYIHTHACIHVSNIHVVFIHIYIYTYMYSYTYILVSNIQVALLGINSALGGEQWEEEEGGGEKERLGAIGAAAMQTAHELVHDAEQVHIGNVFICVTQAHSVTKLHEVARRGVLIYTCVANSICRFDFTNSRTTQSRYTTYSNVSHELNLFLDYTNSLTAPNRCSCIRVT